MSSPWMTQGQDAQEEFARIGYPGLLNRDTVICIHCTGCLTQAQVFMELNEFCIISDGCVLVGRRVI